MNFTKDLELYGRYYYQGIVIDNISPNDSGELKVRIPQLDQNVLDADLAPCYPTSNFQFLRILPKKGERVFIVLDRVLPNSDGRLNQEKRYWQGLSMGNMANIANSPYYYSSNAHETNGWVTNNKTLRDIPISQELYPLEDDVDIRGRDNSDVSLRPNELLLRVGRHEKGLPPIFNVTDPSFIQIKYKKNKFAPVGEQMLVESPIEPSHVIHLAVAGLNTLLKVYMRTSKELVYSVSASYQDAAELIYDTTKRISDLKIEYPQWEFKTDSELFADLPLFNAQYQNTSVENLEIQFAVEKEISSINVVADFINLLSHKSKNYDLVNGRDYIDEQTQDLINNSAQRMVKGDNLLSLLRLMVSYMNNHSHPYHGKAAVNDLILQQINAFDLEQIVSDYLRLS